MENIWQCRPMRSSRFTQVSRWDPMGNVPQSDTSEGFMNQRETYVFVCINIYICVCVCMYEHKSYHAFHHYNVIMSAAPALSWFIKPHEY